MFMLATGCESSLDVFTESDAYYSLFGFIDASADTQWVRIEALQDSLQTGSSALDATLFSTHQSSGDRVIWNDSLFQYLNNFQAHNFWSIEPFLPGETYILEVIRSDGATSEATVIMPELFDEPLFNVFPFSLINLPVSGNVCARSFDTIIEVDILAALEISYVIPTATGLKNTVQVSYINKVQKLETGAFAVRFEWVQDLQRIAALDSEISLPELLQLEQVQLLVAAAGPGWPDNALDDETVALPGAVTEVKNGFGYVGGVVSKRLEIPIGDFRDASCFQ